MFENSIDKEVVVGIVAGLVFLGGIAIGIALNEDSPAKPQPTKSEPVSQKSR